MLALIPGTSRSGITMTAGLFGKLSKKMAAEISFLMAIPVIGAASVLTIKDMVGVGVINASFPSLIVGFFHYFSTTKSSIFVFFLFSRFFCEQFCQIKSSNF